MSEQADDVAYAHVPAGGVVREIIRIPAGAALADRWHPDFVKDMVRLSKTQAERVKVGWIRDDRGRFLPPPVPELPATPQPTLAQLQAQLEALQRRMADLAAATATPPPDVVIEAPAEAPAADQGSAAV